jgi:hypothetical protein
MVFKPCHLKLELEITELASARYMVLSLISIEFFFFFMSQDRKLRQNIHFRLLDLT